MEVVETSIWHAKVTRKEYQVGLNLTGYGVDDPDQNFYENYNPAHYRAIIVGIFMVAIPVARLIGSPISGAILYMDGVLGLGGWQWIFFLEAAPAVLLGLAAFIWLTDRPEHASWLASQQQQWRAATRRCARVPDEFSQTLAPLPHQPVAILAQKTRIKADANPRMTL